MARTRQSQQARATRDFAKGIVSVDEADEHIKILVYGRNGQGKTRFAATANKVLIVDIHERGTRSARGSGAKVRRVTTWSEIAAAYWYLANGEHGYETIALDTLTGMQTACLRHVLREGVDRDPTKDPHVVSQREWGKVNEMMKPLLLQFRNLPMHVIFTAQERVMTDDDDDLPSEHVPDLTPGSRGVAMGSVDIIGRIYQREVKAKARGSTRERSTWEPRLLVGPHEQFVTKDRTGQLGRIVRKPTLPSIIKAANSAAGE